VLARSPSFRRDGAYHAAAISDMDSPLGLRFRTPLPRPQRGGSTRLQVGRSELVLESVRGGHALVWHDGTEARRFALGLDDDGELAVELRVPALPVRLVLRDVASLVPGARLRGYVQVPLVPTVVWQSVDGATAALAEMIPRELAAEWDDRDGCGFRCTSPLQVRFPVRVEVPRATLSLVLSNEGDSVASPAFVPLQLTNDELAPLRGGLVAMARRCIWRGAAWQTIARPFASEVRA
jgi:hypothetical protein